MKRQLYFYILSNTTTAPLSPGPKLSHLGFFFNYFYVYTLYHIFDQNYKNVLLIIFEVT